MAGFTSNLAEGLIPPLREEQEDYEIWWKGEGGSLFIKTWMGGIPCSGTTSFSPILWRSDSKKFSYRDSYGHKKAPRKRGFS